VSKTHDNFSDGEKNKKHLGVSAFLPQVEVRPRKGHLSRQISILGERNAVWEGGKSQLRKGERLIGKVYKGNTQSRAHFNNGGGNESFRIKLTKGGFRGDSRR